MRVKDAIFLHISFILMKYSYENVKSCDLKVIPVLYSSTLKIENKNVWQ